MITTTTSHKLNEKKRKKKLKINKMAHKLNERMNK